MMDDAILYKQQAVSKVHQLPEVLSLARFVSLATIVRTAFSFSGPGMHREMCSKSFSWSSSRMSE